MVVMAAQMMNIFDTTELNLQPCTMAALAGGSVGVWSIGPCTNICRFNSRAGHGDVGSIPGQRAHRSN